MPRPTRLLNKYSLFQWIACHVFIKAFSSLWNASHLVWEWTSSFFSLASSKFLLLTHLISPTVTTLKVYITFPPSPAFSSYTLFNFLCVQAAKLVWEHVPSIESNSDYYCQVWHLNATRFQFISTQCIHSEKNYTTQENPTLTGYCYNVAIYL